MKEVLKGELSESAFIPHLGWLRHDRGDDVVTLLRQGYFEAAEQAFFWLYFRPGDTFIDGGAHIGLYSVIAHRAMDGEGRILAVEPSEHTAVHLEANLEQNGVIEAQVVRAALWKSAESIGFVNENQGRAAYARVAFGEAKPEVHVPAVTLSNLISEWGTGAVTLVKIDVEGAEPEALTGARDAIAKGSAPLLMVEIAEHNLRRRGSTTQELLVQIEEMGYGIFEFSPETLKLKPYRAEGPVWFKNVFACLDWKSVNARLRTASSDRKRIARDILGRAAACARFKELEELDRLRQLADVAEANRAWAERTEQALSGERENSSALREEIKGMQIRLDEAQSGLAKAQGNVIDLAARAESAELQTAENKAWAERTEELLEIEKKISDGNRVWAERIEDLLASQKAISEDLASRLSVAEQAAEESRARAEQSERWLADQKAISEELTKRLSVAERGAEENRVRAQNIESQLTEQKTISEDLLNRLSAKERDAEDNRARAERTGQWLADQKMISDDLGNRLSAMERSARENRAWAEKTEEALAFERRRAETLTARLEEALAAALRLEEEIGPLRSFARRMAWVYRLMRKPARLP